MNVILSWLVVDGDTKEISLKKVFDLLSCVVSTR